MEEVPFGDLADHLDGVKFPPPKRLEHELLVVFEDDEIGRLQLVDASAQEGPDVKHLDEQGLEALVGRPDAGAQGRNIRRLSHVFIRILLKHKEIRRVKGKKTSGVETDCLQS